MKMNETMKRDLERLDLQERDGVALTVIVETVSHDPLKRPLAHREFLPLLSKALGVEIKSTEQSSRILNRLRRCNPPLVTPGGHVGRLANILPTRAGEALVKKWRGSAATPS